MKLIREVFETAIESEKNSTYNEKERDHKYLLNKALLMN